MQKVSPAPPCSAPLQAAWDWRAVALIGAVAAALFALRLCAPSNLLDQDQENPATYVLDAVKNGHWLCQRDLFGNITSKPPLYTWLAALTALACGEVNLFALYLPGALALFGSAYLVWVFGRQHFGQRAALFGALACMLSTAGLKQFGLARTDGVFAFTVTLAALLAYRAWICGNGWTWFWLAAAAATLTKGPLGLALAAGGLLACWWESRSGAPRPLRGSHILGVSLYVALTAGWLGLACWDSGRAVLDKLFLQELVFHVVEGENKKIPGSLFYLSSLYYLARAAPWSVLAFYGLWRLCKSPAAALEERRFERFLFCWFLAGLALFSFAPHQRGDLLWPIMPAGALLAGRELARSVRPSRMAALDRAMATALGVALAGFGLYFFGPRAKQPFIQQTMACRALAQQIAQLGTREFPLTHTDDPAGLQVFLNTYRPPVSFERAAALLRGPEAAYVAVHDWPALQAAMKPQDPPLYTLLEDRGPVTKLKTRIVSNRSRFVPNEPVAVALGPWLVRAQSRLESAHGDHLVFARTAQEGQVTVLNQGGATRRIDVTVLGTPTTIRSSHTLDPGQSITLPSESLR